MVLLTPQAPLLTPWVNHLRTGLYSSLAWIGFMLVVLVFEKDQSYEHRQLLTTVR